MDGNQRVLIYEIVGIVFIIFLGSALHFTYAFSGKQAVVGIFSAVNESVWEHLKMAFWPSLLWSAIEYVPLRKTASNFFAAKAISTYLMVFFIPAVFYAYTPFTEASILTVDILSFVVGVTMGQLVSYKIFVHKKLSRTAEIVAVLALAFLGTCFVIFTFYTPHLPIFEDSATGLYGINQHW